MSASPPAEKPSPGRAFWPLGNYVGYLTILGGIPNASDKIRLTMTAAAVMENHLCAEDIPVNGNQGLIRAASVVSCA